MTTAERDYVLGTHDDEVMRLGLQHRVWRPRALDATAMLFAQRWSRIQQAIVEIDDASSSFSDLS